jgi:phage baseplate assembly protein gpV
MRLKRILYWTVFIGGLIYLIIQSYFYGPEENHNPKTLVIYIDTAWMNYDASKHKFIPQIDTLYKCLETGEIFRLKHER